MSGDQLYEKVIEAAGLGLVGPFAVKRMLLRVQVFSPAELTRAKLRAALPHLEEAIALYRSANEAADAISKVRRLAEEAAV